MSYTLIRIMVISGYIRHIWHHTLSYWTCKSPCNKSQITLSALLSSNLKRFMHESKQLLSSLHNTNNYPYQSSNNKANLRDLIAATGLVILLKLDSNLRFFSHVTLKLDWWPRKIIGHLFYITSSFVHHLKSLGEFELQLLSRNAQFGSKSAIFCPGWPWNSMDDLEKNRDPLLCYIKLCASFQSHRWIQTKVTVRKRSIRAKMGDFLPRVTLKFDG